MTVLAFDCAVSGLGVAILRDGVRLASLVEDGRDQAARLLPAVEAVLAEAGVGRRELSLVAVTIGPGSFTGVRIGLAAARGLSVGLGVPLAGLSTTSVLLAQAPPRDRVVVASAGLLASRLEGKACLVIGSGAEALAGELIAAGVDTIAEEALPDPVILGRLAVDIGADNWRVQNAREGLPRPLYLRGVNITLPDGARRTVD